MQYFIVEGAESTWFYHLSSTGKTGAPALCGKTNMMHTEIPLANWNTLPSHLHERYCNEIYQRTNDVYCIFSCNYWTDKLGNKLNPFTVVTVDDIESGKIVPLFEKQIAIDWQKIISNNAQ